MEIFRLFGTILIDNKTANESIHRTSDLAEKTGEKFLGLAGKAQKAGGSFTDVANKAGNMALKVQAAIGVLQTTIFAFAKGAATAADRVDKLSQKLGMSRQAFQEWDYVLSQNGASIEQLQAGMKTLNKRMEEAAKGAGSGAEAFKKLELSATDAKGKLKSQEQMFEDIVRVLTKMPDGIEKSKLAFQLLGKAGTELLPMLNGTAESIDELKQRANELGIVMSDETVDAGVKLGDTIDDVKKSFEGIKNKVGAEVMPQVQKFLDSLLQRLPRITEKAVAFAKAVGDLLIGLMDFNDALGGIPAKLLLFIVLSGKTVGSVGKMISGVREMHGVFKQFTEWAGAAQGLGGLGAILSNPFLVATVAVVGLVAEIIVLIKTYKELKQSREAEKEQQKQALSNAEYQLNLAKKDPETYRRFLENMKNMEIDVYTHKDLKEERWEQRRKEHEEKAQYGGGKSFHGSHAGGLDYVPFDGYIAKLHRGERVLTAEEARKERRTEAGGDTISVIIQAVYMKDKTDIDKLVEEIERRIRNRKRALGRA